MGQGRVTGRIIGTTLIERQLKEKQILKRKGKKYPWGLHISYEFPCLLYDYKKILKLSVILVGHYKNVWCYDYYNHLLGFKYRSGSEKPGIYIQLSSFP